MFVRNWIWTNRNLLAVDLSLSVLWLSHSGRIRIPSASWAPLICTSEGDLHLWIRVFCSFSPCFCRRCSQQVVQSGVAQQGHGLVAELGPQQNKPVPWHFGSHPKVNEQQCGSYGECRKQNEVLDLFGFDVMLIPKPFSSGQRAALRVPFSNVTCDVICCL